MSWRDLKPVPDDWYEMERPEVSEQVLLVKDNPGITDPALVLEFSDPVSREWFAEWLRSRRGWQAFNVWVDERR
jgi:hypothetical protein